MPRANRYFLPGYIWHITHRRHQRKFLLKFARDRRCYLYWVFEAKKRYGLSVLTSNPIHLPVKDTCARVTPESMVGDVQYDVPIPEHVDAVALRLFSSCSASGK